MAEAMEIGIIPSMSKGWKYGGGGVSNAISSIAKDFLIIIGYE
nr:hypothetical protein [uncultured Prevotella sp.]